MPLCISHILYTTFQRLWQSYRSELPQCIAFLDDEQESSVSLIMNLMQRTASSPILTTGQDFLHSCLHFLGLQRSALTIAILVNLSCSDITLNLIDHQYAQSMWLRSPSIQFSDVTHFKTFGGNGAIFCL